MKRASPCRSRSSRAKGPRSDEDGHPCPPASRAHFAARRGLAGARLPRLLHRAPRPLRHRAGQHPRAHWPSRPSAVRPRCSHRAAPDSDSPERRGQARRGRRRRKGRPSAADTVAPLPGAPRRSARRGRRPPERRAPRPRLTRSLPALLRAARWPRQRPCC